MKLLSFGEIVWDLYGDRKFLGGAPLNFAAHAALQGCDAYLLSTVGQDPLGEEALARIPALGVRADHISDTPHLPTGQCLVTLNDQGVPSYHLPDHLAYDEIPLPTGLEGSFDVLSFGTMVLRRETNRETLARLLRQNHFSEIYTDLNIRPPFYSYESVHLCLSNATIAKISDEELPTVARVLGGSEEEEAESVRKILNAYPQIKLLLLTKGDKGTVCYCGRDGGTIACPAAPATVVSTVGAGDSFGATFLVEYHKGAPLSACLRRASEVSAFVVSHEGAIPEETASFLANKNHSNNAKEN